MVVANINRILDAARELGASDIHLKVGSPPILRIQGNLTALELDSLDVGYLNNAAQSLLGEEKKVVLDSRSSVDSSYRVIEGDKEFRYRINVSKEREGHYFAAIRCIPDCIPDIKDVGFPNEVWRKIVDMNSGLVLVTGVTGSGKTTTLAALIEEINKTRVDHIITLEDPIEFVYKPKRSIISQRELGTSLNTFGDGVKYALRQDPDVILIGEIRDKETAEKAIEAAATGHLVFSTLHCLNAWKAPERLVNIFPPEDHEGVRDSLANTLSYVLTQQLIPYQKGVGRTLAMEVLNIREDTGVQHEIRKGEYFRIKNQIQTGFKYDMISMDKHLEHLVEVGKISIENALFYAHEPSQLKLTFERLGLVRNE